MQNVEGGENREKRKHDEKQREKTMKNDEQERKARRKHDEKQ